MVIDLLRSYTTSSRDAWVCTLRVKQYRKINQSGRAGVFT